MEDSIFRIVANARQAAFGAGNWVPRSNCPALNLLRTGPHRDAVSRLAGHPARLRLVMHDAGVLSLVFRE